jgi:hypothetical protein
MKKFTFMFLAMIAVSGAFAQGSHVVSGSYLESKTFDYAPRFQTIMRGMTVNEFTPRSSSLPLETKAAPAMKTSGTSAVSAVQLGSASNAFNWVRTENNVAYANDSLGICVQLHRQDIATWGGTVGHLRYDMNTNKGDAGGWNNDIGNLNPTITKQARYPGITGFNNSGGSNPFAAKLPWVCPALGASTWDGHVSGLANVATSSGSLTSTENYPFSGKMTLIPSALCQGMPGEFWYTDLSYDGTNVLDSIYVYKGIYNATTTDVDWERVATITAPYNLVPDGASHFLTPVMDFDPTGTYGYIAYAGDLVGGTDSAYMPILIPTTDGGATWGAPKEYDLNSIAWIADSLQILWVDSLGNPASNGRATCAFDMDMVVDANGNPHIGVVIGTAASGTPYSISSGLAMFLADIYSDDLGATIKVDYMAPVLTLRGDWGGASGSAPITMDNFVQATRSPDANKVFFMWVDSDSATVGFGVTDNLSPNMRIVGKRVTDGHRTCFKLVTDGDILWEGQIIFPWLAPQTVRRSSADHLFSGFISFLVPADELNTTLSYTLIDDTWFDDSEFNAPSFYTDLSWDGPCVVTSKKPSVETSNVSLHQSYPNPTSGFATIPFELAQSGNVTLTLTNLHGQQINVLAEGTYSAGMHKVEVNTSTLAPGIYLYTLTTGDLVITKKMTVTR